MAICRLARNTTTSQTFWARLDSAATLGVKVNGGSNIEGDAVTTSTNLCGIVTATGLDPDTEYTYQITADGSDVSGLTATFRTLPQAGSNADILFSICSLEANPCFAAMLNHERHGLPHFASEWVYIDGNEYSTAPASATEIQTLVASNNPSSDSNGMNEGTFTGTGSDFNLFLNSYRAKHVYSYIAQTSTISNKWRHEYAKRFALRLMWDNHELYTSVINTPDPGQNLFDGAMRAAWECYFMGNPASDGTDTVPTMDGTTPFPPYFAETVGDVEILALDAMSATELATTVRYVGRGVTDQIDWAMAKIAASTAKFGILFLPKVFSPNYPDIYGASGTLINALNDKDQTWVVISGDIHRPFARLINHATYTPDRPFLEVGVSPLRQVSNDAAVPSITGQTMYFDPLPAQANIQTPYSAIFTKAQRDACNWIYGKAKSRPNGSAEHAGSHLKIEQKNPLTGRVRKSFIIPEGGREPVIIGGAG